MLRSDAVVTTTRALVAKARAGAPLLRPGPANSGAAAPHNVSRSGRILTRNWMRRLSAAAGAAVLLAVALCRVERAGPPIVLNTWAFTNATDAAWRALQEGGSAMDAVEQASTSLPSQRCSSIMQALGRPDDCSRV